MVLTVKPEGGLRLTCARGTSQREIREFVKASEEFIAKSALRFEAKRREHPNKEFVSGEQFLFFGRTLPLDLVWGWQKRVHVEATESTLEMRAPLTSTVDERAKAMRLFFRKQAELHLPEEVAACARLMGLHPAKLTIRGQVTRWGSCSSRGVISLNWKLMAAPVDVIRYVVVHEIAHLEHPNHSSRFWGLVERHFPNYEVSKRWLRENEFRIFRQFGSTVAQSNSEI